MLNKTNKNTESGGTTLLEASDNKKYKDFKDEEILALSIKTPSAFEMVISRYQDAFLRTAYKIVRQREEAEDVVQEAFTKIYLNAKKFKKVENASFKSWAYKILVNTAFNHYKKLKKNLERFEYFNEKSSRSCLAEDNALENDSQEDMKSLVSRVLTLLPEHLGVVLKKYYIEDKSQKNIANEEGVSVTTIKMRLFRAKRAFKKIANVEVLSWKIIT